jgi:hypothetical protein
MALISVYSNKTEVKIDGEATGGYSRYLIASNHYMIKIAPRHAYHISKESGGSHNGYIKGIRY